MFLVLYKTRAASFLNGFKNIQEKQVDFMSSVVILKACFFLQSLRRCYTVQIFVQLVSQRNFYKRSHITNQVVLRVLHLAMFHATCLVSMITWG